MRSALHVIPGLALVAHCCPCAFVLCPVLYRLFQSWHVRVGRHTLCWWFAMQALWGIIRSSSSRGQGTCPMTIYVENPFGPRVHGVASTVHLNNESITISPLFLIQSFDVVVLGARSCSSCCSELFPFAAIIYSSKHQHHRILLRNKAVHSQNTLYTGYPIQRNKFSDPPWGTTWRSC